MVLRSEILVNKNVLPTQEQALPGRETPMQLPENHYVFKNTPLLGPFLDNVGFAIFDQLFAPANRVRAGGAGTNRAHVGALQAV